MEEKSGKAVPAPVAARVLSIQVGKIQQMPASAGQKGWESALRKQPVVDAILAGELGLDGDEHADKANHGGPDQAINCFASEHYAQWQPLTAAGLTFGGLGENFTVEGLVEETVCIGDIFEAGEALLQVSQPRQPCWKLGRLWETPEFAARLIRAGHTGWFCRVLRPGYVAAGTPLVLVERPYPEWTIARTNEIAHFRRDDLDATRALAACPALSAEWQARLQKRADGAK